MFFTGDAGTGKSYLLRVLVEALQEQVGKDKVFVTASTGIAACNIGGITVHSFAGLGIAEMDLNHTLRKIRQNESAVDRWKTCSVLVIDEISMLDGRLFDTLEYTARVLRCSDLPFGGIQVVLCGDFFQLPPVGLGRNGVIFCFEARWWNAVVEVREEIGCDVAHDDHAEGVSTEGSRVAGSSSRDSICLGGRAR